MTRRMPGWRIAMLVLLLAAGSLHAGEIHKWTDAEGRVHFGDREPGKPAAAKSAAYGTKSPPSSRRYTLSVEDPDAVLDDDAHARLETGVEKIFAVYTGLFRLSMRKPVAINIHLFSTHGELAAHVAGLGVTQPLPPLLLGLFLPQHNFVGAWQHSDDDNDIVATLLHETSHVLLAQLAPNAPAWLHEGLAQYFECLDPGEDGYVIHPKAEAMAAIDTWTARKELVTLNQYFALGEARWRHLAHAEANPIPYVVAWSVAYFMMSKPVGRQIIYDLLQTMEKTGRVPTPDAIERRYPGGYALMEYEWFKWAQGKKPPQDLRW